MQTLLWRRWVDEVVTDAPWVINQEFLDKHKIDYVTHDALPYSDASGQAADVYDFVSHPSPARQLTGLVHGMRAHPRALLSLPSDLLLAAVLLTLNPSCTMLLEQHAGPAAESATARVRGTTDTSASLFGNLRARLHARLAAAGPAGPCRAPTRRAVSSD